MKGKSQVVVLFDSQYSFISGLGGIKNYWDRILDHENEFRNHGVTLIQSNPFHMKKILASLGRYEYQLGPKYKRFIRIILRRLTLKVFNTLSTLLIWVRKYGCNRAIVSTYYDLHPSRYRLFSKHVTTIHDMIPEDFPEFFPFGSPHRYKRQYLRSASHVVCVSEYTKSRLLFHYPEVRDKVTVIHHGLDKSSLLNLERAEPIDSLTGEQFFLYVGNRNYYKNFQVLASGLSRIFQKYPSLKLILVGGEVENIFLRYGLAEWLKNNIIQIRPTDSQLIWLYSEARFSIVTSKVEGFGLPIIEAMNFDCLNLLSDIPVFREVAGEGALYFDPDSDSDLMSLIETVMTNGDICLRTKHLASDWIDVRYRNQIDALTVFYKSL